MAIGVVDIEHDILTQPLANGNLERVVVGFGESSPGVQSAILRMKEEVVHDSGPRTNLPRTRMADASWTVIPLQLAEGIVSNVGAANRWHRNSLVSSLRCCQSSRNTENIERAGQPWQYILEPGNGRNTGNGCSGVALIDEQINRLIPGHT